MTAHVLVLSSPDPVGAESRQKYAGGVRPLLAAAGAKPLLSGAIVETPAGSDRAGTVTVLEFPNAALAKAFFEQEAYKALIPYRDKGFSQMEILVIDELP